MAEVDPELKALLDDVVRLGKALDERIAEDELLERYYDGDHPIPEAVRSAKATKAYQRLMTMAKSNFPKLIVDSVEERLEVTGFRFADKDTGKKAWKHWQANGLDADAGLVHKAALTTGRAFAIVWAGDDGQPKVNLEHSSTCIVEYEPGSQRVRRQALRRWKDGKRWYATLYRPDGLYKFQARRETADPPRSWTSWEKREVETETWPLNNAIGLVNVVEIAVNRRLKFNPFGTGRGEYADVLGHIDRINYTIFSALAAMTWSGFPILALIGDPIAYEAVLDDDGNPLINEETGEPEEGDPLQPFDVRQDSVVQIENPDGKLVRLPEATLENYLKSAESYIRHLAAITKTPVHQFLADLINVGVDAVRAADAGNIGKSKGHMRTLGEGWEEIARLMLLVENPNDQNAKDPTVETEWRDPEALSLAEAADAVSKVGEVLPWEAILIEIMKMPRSRVDEYRAMRAAEGLLEAAKPAALPVPPTAA